MKRLLLLFALSALVYSQARSFRDATLLHDAAEAARRGTCQEAVALYRQIRSPDDAVRYNLAGCLYRLGRYRRALDLYRQIRAPELNARRYFDMGDALFHLGRYQEALASWRNALKFGDDPDAESNIRRLERWLQKQTEEELRAKEKKSKVDPLRKGFNTPDAFRDGNRSKEKLVEAKIHDRGTRANLARNSRGAQGDARAESRDFRLRIHGKKSFEIDRGIEENYWRSRLRRRPMQTLLIPIPRKGADRDLPPR